jgi:hypothetical protein
VDDETKAALSRVVGTLRGEPLAKVGSRTSFGGLFPKGMDLAHASVRKTVSLSGLLLIWPSAPRTGDGEDPTGRVVAGIYVLSG